MKVTPFVLEYGYKRKGITVGKFRQINYDQSYREWKGEDSILKDGFKKERHSNGIIYEGECKGYYNVEGKGKITFPCSSTWEGNFKQNKFDGIGDMKLKDGRKVKSKPVDRHWAVPLEE